MPASTVLGIILALTLPLLHAAAQEAPGVALSSSVIVVGHDVPVIVTLAASGCKNTELALYAPADETSGLTDENLVEVLRLAATDGQATISPADLGSWAGHRLYIRAESSDCGPGAWAVLDVAYVSDADNALAPATVRFPAELLDIPVSNPPGATLGVIMGTISAFANGQLCSSVALGEGRSAGQDEFLRLGQEGQPAACRTEGARITFRASLFTGDADSALYEDMDLLLGVTQTLRNFGTVPPDSGDNGATGTPAPPAAGTGSLNETGPAPNAESPLVAAGESADHARWWPWAAAAFVTLVALVLAVRLRPRPWAPGPRP